MPTPRRRPPSPRPILSRTPSATTRTWWRRSRRASSPGCRQEGCQEEEAQGARAPRDDDDEEGDESRPSPRSSASQTQGQEEEDAQDIKPDGTEVELEEEDEDEEEEPHVPPPPPVAPNKCTFHIEIETNFGDHLCLTGGHPLLGDWSPVNGVPMDWVEGNKWKVTVPLPAHQLIQYKYVVRSGWAPDGETRWQGGPDGMISTGPEHSSVEIHDKPQWHSWGDGHPSVKAVPAAAEAFQKVKAPRTGSSERTCPNPSGPGRRCSTRSSPRTSAPPP